MNEPAFPVHQITNGGFVPVGGMTLRDYFAAKAMQAFISMPETHVASMDKKISVEEVCGASYQWADAMLKSRTEPKGE